MWMSLVLPMLFPFILQTNVQPASKSYSQLLFSGSISLENRHENKYVNDVFKDNILLSLAYMRGMIDDKYKISWDNVRQEFKYSLTLSPNTTFAFHEDVLSKYKNTLSATTKAHFNYQEGFKSDGYLVGDGVCHLASLIYWVSNQAGLDAYAPTSHNFARIPEIEREFGVSIYSMPGNIYANSLQNIYVTNDRENSVVFEFDYDGKRLKLSIYEEPA